MINKIRKVGFETSCQLVGSDSTPRVDGKFQGMHHLSATHNLFKAHCSLHKT